MGRASVLCERNRGYVLLTVFALPLAGVTSVAATAGLIEAIGDRDWAVRGFEWPEVFVIAAVLALLGVWLFAPARVLTGAEQGISGGARSTLRPRSLEPVVHPLSSELEHSRLELLPTVVRTTLRHLLLPAVHLYMRWFPAELGKRALWTGWNRHLTWLEPSRATARTRDGIELQVDPREPTGRYLRYFGVWEPNLTAFVRRRLSAGDVFVDVGAHIGYFSVLAAGVVGEGGSVVALEPQPDAYALLVANCAASGCSNVRAIEAAASDTEGEGRLWTSRGLVTGKSTTAPAWADRYGLAEQVTVRTTPASDVLSAQELGRVRLVKIDVEGGEWRVLRGLERLLRNARDALEIVVEITPRLLEADGADVGTLLSYLAEFGFAPFELENDYSVGAYVGRRKPRPPERIATVPAGRRRMEIVFSKSTGSRL